MPNVVRIPAAAAGGQMGEGTFYQEASVSGALTIDFANGYYVEATIFTGVPEDHELVKTEMFLPILYVGTFKTREEALEMANDTEYGLAAYFYTRDLGRAWRVSEALEYGMVGVNSGIISTAVAPFGGVKQSGLGREGARYGIDEYLEIKYVCVDIGR